MATVVWSLIALRDFEISSAYLAHISPILASRFEDRVDAAVHQLLDFPQSGRVASELRSPDLRELVIPPYRLIYRIEDEVIHVERLVNSKQDMRTWFRNFLWGRP